ncbi:MAG: hypothetical protein OJI67_05165 [Prosthecobacter sp.]|nr:hypothetical protein [Prosthecobacter sp.]
MAIAIQGEKVAQRDYPDYAILDATVLGRRVANLVPESPATLTDQFLS